MEVYFFSFLRIEYTKHRFAQKIPTLNRPFYKHSIPVSRSSQFITVFHLHVYTHACHRWVIEEIKTEMLFMK